MVLDEAAGTFVPVIPRGKVNVTAPNRLPPNERNRSP